MELITSMFSIVKSVSDTDRDFKILKQKMEYGIKKAETVLEKSKQEHHVHSFVAVNLNNRLQDAKEQFVTLENLLSSSSAPESISL